MNLAIRDIRHNLGRFVSTGVGLGLLIGVVMTMGGIYRGLIADATAVVDAVNADIWVVQKDTFGPFADQSRVPEDLQYNIRAVPGVAEASPLSFQTMQVMHVGRSLRFQVIGFNPGGLGGPAHLVAGRNISRKRYELVADKKLKLKLGEELHLGLHDYKVVGLVQNMVSTGGDPVIYLSLSDAQELQFQKNNEAIRNDQARLSAALKPLQKKQPALYGALESDLSAIVGNTHIANCIVARVSPGADAEAVAAAIARWNHYTALTDEAQRDLLTQKVIEKPKKQLGLFRIILLVISTVVIALIIYTLTIGKIRELATLKLIGAPNTRIAGLILQQSLALGIIGYIIGAILIYWTYDLYPRRVVLVPIDMQVLFLIIVGICLLGSLQGLRTALKVDPSVVLGA